MVGCVPMMFETGFYYHEIHEKARKGTKCSGARICNWVASNVSRGC